MSDTDKKNDADMFGDSDEDEAPPPPPGTSNALDDSDDDLPSTKVKLPPSILDKDSDEEDGDEKLKTADSAQKGNNNDDDDPFGDSDSDDDDGDAATRKKIDVRKSLGSDNDNDDEDEDEDDEDSDDEDEDEDEEEDEDDEEGAGDGGDDNLFEVKSKKAKRKRGETAPADGKGKKPKKKKKKRDVSRFFADLADVAEDSEEEEGPVEKGADEEQLTKDELEARALVEARHKKNREMLDTDASELAARYEKQHQAERKRVKIMREMATGLGGVGGGTIAQQALLPSINDPSIWRIKCAPGREFQLVRSIFLKHMAKQATGNTNSTLKSAFHNSSKGYIYVEAMSEVCAKDAIQGLRGLYFTTMTKVPVNEMTNVLRCTTDKVPLKVGQWVRVRRGPFKGDLARVIDIFDGGERCFIMAVPRPDYTLMASDTKKNAKSTIRPSQKLFDSVDASSTGFEVERRSNPSDRRGDFYDYWKNDYYKDGFWFKEVTTETYINNVNVKPKLEELQLFKGRKSGDGLQSDDEDEYDYDDMDAANEDKKAKHLATKNAALGITDGSKLDDADDGDVESNGTILREKRDAPSMQQQLRHELNNQMKQIEDEAAIATVRAVPFVINDIVEVVSGELKGLIAQVVATYDTTDVVDVIPYQSNLLDDRTKISIESSILVKYVTPGNHVKIIDGRYMGTTGRVVSVQILDGDRVCSVLTDGVNTEIQINVSAVQISAEVSMGHGNLGGYEVHDLVSLSENETACIFHVGAEKLRVLNHLDIVKDVFPQEISTKRNNMSQRSSAFDSQQQTITNQDVVKVISGTYSGKSGSVLHIMKGNVWIHSNNHLKNGGVMVIRGRNCKLAGSAAAGSTSNASKANADLNRALGRQTAIGEGSLSTQQIQTFRPGGGTGFGKDPIIGKTVKIIKGGYKGYLAQVVEVTPTKYAVELLARVKKMMIDKTKCKVVGDKFGAFDKSSGESREKYAREGTVLEDVSTPFLTAETPSHYGSETPMHGSLGNETPMHDGGQTPGGDDIFKPNERDRLDRQKEEEKRAAERSQLQLQQQQAAFETYQQQQQQQDALLASQQAMAATLQQSYGGVQPGAYPGQYPQGTMGGYAQSGMGYAQPGMPPPAFGMQAGNIGYTPISLTSDPHSSTTSPAYTQSYQAPQPPAPLDHTKWKDGMIAQIVNSAHPNHTRYGAIKSEVNHRNEIAFSLIDSTGALGTYVMLQYTDLALVPVVINAYVRIVDGSTGSDASAEYGKVEEIQPDRGTCRVRMSQHNYLKDVWLNHCAVCYQN